MGKTFFISSRGSDSNPGSRAKPWRTVGRANEQPLEPGDSVSLEAGKTFEGTLAPAASGTAQEPIVFGSFGTGVATVHAGANSAIHLGKPVSHVCFENLVLTGDWSTEQDAGTSNATGVLLENPHHYAGITLRNLDVSGFGAHGILVWGSSEDLRIEGCKSHDNRHDGIVLRPQSWIDMGHKRPVLADCMAYGNTGLSNYTAEHSGSGILVGGAQDGVVERCVAYGNGMRCASLSGGPVGIWMWMSRNTVIRDCESHHNACAGSNDGGGFDVDGGCENCSIEYCFSHDNEGPGLLVAAYAGGGLVLDNSLHHNVSINDCTNHLRGGTLVLWNGLPDATGIQRTSIHHNVLAAMRLIVSTYGASTTDTVICENRFMIPRTRRFCVFPVTGPGFVLEQNHYFTGAARLLFEVDRVHYAGFDKLQRFKFEKKGAHDRDLKEWPEGFPRPAPSLNDGSKVREFVEDVLKKYLKP